MCARHKAGRDALLVPPYLRGAEPLLDPLPRHSPAQLNENH